MYVDHQGISRGYSDQFGAGLDRYERGYYRGLDGAFGGLDDGMDLAVKGRLDALNAQREDERFASERDWDREKLDRIQRDAAERQRESLAAQERMAGFQYDAQRSLIEGMLERERIERQAQLDALNEKRARTQGAIYRERERQPRSGAAHFLPELVPDEWQPGFRFFEVP